MKRIHSILFIGLFIFLLSCSKGKESKEEVFLDTTLVDTSKISLSYLNSLHKKTNFKSYDASLLEYIHSNPNRPDSIKNKIYILPLGDISILHEKLLQHEVEYLRRFFQLQVVIMNRVPFDDIKKMNKVTTRLVPSEDYEYYGKMKEASPTTLKEQIEAKSLIENYIIGNKPKDAIAVLGITEHDLYLPEMNFIYGTSYLKNGVGLISTYRITEDPRDSKMNVRKVATKQIVNLFSIPNVKDYTCVVNYHNNIHELRQGVNYISPRALEKLKFAIGFDYTKRFVELRDFWKSEKDSEMTNYYEKCIQLKPGVNKKTSH